MKIFITHNRLLLNIGKWVITLVAFFYLVFQLLNAPSIDLTIPNSFLLFSACIFTPINLAFETAKWRLSIHLFEPQSLWHNIKSVFIGITLGIITPFQIGDMAGKISYVNHLSKEKALIVATAGGLAQACVSFSIGILGMAFWLHTTYSLQLGFILAIASFFSLVVLFCYINLSKIIPHFFYATSAITVVANQFSTSSLFNILLLSIFRYIVYATQLFLILQAFEIQLSIGISLMCISSIFFIQGFVPSFVFTDISVRGAAIIFILSPFIVNITPALAATYILWLLNRIIPSIIGWFLLVYYNPAHFQK